MRQNSISPFGRNNAFGRRDNFLNQELDKANNTMNNITKAFEAAFCGMTIFASCAFAQDAGNDAEKGGEQKWFERESLVLQPVVDKIAPDSGFTPSAVWTGEVWGNVSRGSDIRSMVDSLLTVGIEQDISKLVGKDGWGTFGISAFWFGQSHGRGLGVESSQGDCSNIFASEMVRVFEIYYANEFETKAGTIGFRIGQLAADEDFMGMDYSDAFLNSSFGAMPNIAPGELFSQYSVATLGVVVYYNYENFDATFGFYNGNVGVDRSSNNGFDYSDTFETVAFWYQFGYNYKLGELEGRAMFGGNYHSDPSKVGLDGRNFYSFYFGLQQAFLNDSEGNAFLGGFARIGWVPSSESSANNFYADFGLNVFGPIPQRPDDVFAVGFSVIENERDARYVDGFAHYEGTLEITYKAQITPAISFQPDFQIFFNPADRDDHGAAYVIGARAEVVF